MAFVILIDIKYALPISTLEMNKARAAESDNTLKFLTLKPLEIISRHQNSRREFMHSTESRWWSQANKWKQVR